MSQSWASNSQGSKATSGRKRGGFFKPEFNYEGRIRFCNCGVVSPRMTAWTKANVGRRFYGCRYWGTADECIFFEWHDGEIIGRAHDVIWHLKQENELLKSEQKNVSRGNRGNPSHVEDCIKDLRADLREINVERCFEKLKDYMLKEIDYKMKAMGDNVCAGIENSVRRQIMKFVMNVMALVVVILVFVYGQLLNDQDYIV